MEIKFPVRRRKESGETEHKRERIIKNAPSEASRNAHLTAKTKPKIPSSAYTKKNNNTLMPYTI